MGRKLSLLLLMTMLISSLSLPALAAPGDAEVATETVTINTPSALEKYVLSYEGTADVEYSGPLDPMTGLPAEDPNGENASYAEGIKAPKSCHRTRADKRRYDSKGKDKSADKSHQSKGDCRHRRGAKGTEKSHCHSPRCTEFFSNQKGCDADENKVSPYAEKVDFGERKTDKKKGHKGGALEENKFVFFLVALSG